MENSMAGRPRKTTQTEIEHQDDDLVNGSEHIDPDEDFIDPVAPEAVAPKEEPEPEEQADTVEELATDWYPGAPCKNCGERGYKWTVAWGDGCSLCLIPQPEEVEEVRSGYEG